jgi:hypothetical protein
VLSYSSIMPNRPAPVNDMSMSSMSSGQGLSDIRLTTSLMREPHPKRVNPPRLTFASASNSQQTRNFRQGMGNAQ